MPPSTSVPQPPAVITVLMAVYNGARYLEAQLDSIAAQTHPDWRVIASDDGSTDASKPLLEAVAGRWTKEHVTPLEIIDGPRQGAAENFMSLLHHAAGQATPPEWIAFSDQDDIWLEDKLARAQAALRAHPADVPALYCARTWIMDPQMEQRRLSAPRPRPPGFRNALVQNIASGNTILLNPAASAMVLEAATQIGQVVVHDWWVYQLVTGAGGTVVHDDTPALLYRQHPDNEIGANDTLRAKAKRIGQLLKGDFRDWNRINVATLNITGQMLTARNRQILSGFESLPKRALLPRLFLLRRLGLYRQSLASTVALWVAATLGKL